MDANSTNEPDSRAIDRPNRRPERAGLAAFYFTVALALDPEQVDARRRLCEMAPDLPPGVLPDISRG